MNSRTLTLLAVALLFAGVFALDHLAGRELNMWLLYVFPISLGTFILGTRAGMVLSGIACLLLFLNGHLLGNPYSSTLPYVFDRCSDLVAYILITALMGVLRTRYESFKLEVLEAPGLPD
jgi:hypothetical protein